MLFHFMLLFNSDFSTQVYLSTHLTNTLINGEAVKKDTLRQIRNNDIIVSQCFESLLPEC